MSSEKTTATAPRACDCYAAVRKAVTSGMYVRWKGPWSDGFVLAVEDPEWLVLTTCGEHLPFQTGFAQAIALGYTFESCGDFAA